MKFDFINKVITIVSKEEKKTKTGTNTTVTITDQDGIRYVYWKKVKDGSASSVAQQFKDMDLDEGSVVQISYVVEEYTGSDNKPHTSNKVTGFRETNAQPVTGQAPQKATQPKYTPVSEDKATDWDKIAVGKCQTVFLQAYIQSGKTFEDAKLQVVQARKLAELVVYGTQQAPQEVTETIQDDEIPLPNIPF